MIWTWIKYAFICILAVFAPVKAMASTVCWLILADFVFGIWAAIKRGERIQSAVASHTVIKFLVYLSTIRIAWSVQMNLLENIFPICNIVAGLIACVEMKSFLENAEDILGQPIFAGLINQLKRKEESGLDVKPSVVITQNSTSQTVIQEEMKRPDNE